MESFHRIYHTAQSPLIGIINNKTDKKNRKQARKVLRKSLK